MDLDGRNKRDVSGKDAGFAYGYSASPDGKFICYHENYQLYVSGADGTNKKHIKTGNPFMILVVSGVLLVNGGTGLVKVALLRFAKVRILHNVRFPLHDHVRQNGSWSNPQVLVRFTVLQVMLAMVLLLLLIKIR